MEASQSKAPAPTPIFSDIADDEVFKSLIKEYAGELWQRVLQLDTAMAKMDLGEVKSLCHKNMGAAQTYGFRTFAESLRLLEVGADAKLPFEILTKLLTQVKIIALGIQVGAESDGLTPSKFQ